MAADEWLARRARQRRWAVALGGLGLAAVVALFFVFGGDDDGDTVDASGGSTPEAAGNTTLPSVKGKPCLALASDLPEGAPEFEIEEGTPPKELVKKDLKEGDGKAIKADDTITVKYLGAACSSGEIFDQNFDREPLTLPLSSFIQGWQNGLVGMKVGGQRLLGIPASLAYGETGTANIAPDETLWFVIQLEDTAPTTTTTTIDPLASTTTLALQPTTTGTVAGPGL
jgi:peptidylprolyl isomerase